MTRLLHPSKDFGHSFHCMPEKKIEEKRLKAVIAITAVVMFIEIAGGFLSNSLALLSDAGHMLTHLFALLMALLSIIISCRPASASKTFGYYRAEVLAALFNSITIIAIVLFIFHEAYRKILQPSPVNAVEMLAIAVVGLVANLAGAAILSRSVKKDINIKGAFYHLLSDLLSSVAIVIGGVLIIYTGYAVIDPILSIVIAAVVLVWGIRLLMESVHILLEAAPKEIEIERIEEELLKIGGIRKIHDVHVWQIASGMYAMTAHVIVGNKNVRECERIVAKMNSLLSEKFSIGHTNFQFEEK